MSHRRTNTIPKLGLREKAPWVNCLEQTKKLYIEKLIIKRKWNERAGEKYTERNERNDWKDRTRKKQIRFRRETERERERERETLNQDGKQRQLGKDSCELGERIVKLERLEEVKKGSRV